MKRRSFLQLLGAVGLAPAVPAAAAAVAQAAPIAAAPVAAPAAAAAVVGATMRAMRELNEYYGSPSFVEAIDEAMNGQVELDVELLGPFTPPAIDTIIDREWFEGKCLPNVDFILQQMPDDMKFNVVSVTQSVEHGSQLRTRMLLKETS